MGTLCDETFTIDFLSYLQMDFERTNDRRRLLLLQNNLYGDFSAGWNGIRTNSLGHRLVRGCIEGLSEIDFFPSLAGFGDWFLGLVFLET